MNFKLLLCYYVLMRPYRIVYFRHRVALLYTYKQVLLKDIILRSKLIICDLFALIIELKVCFISVVA